MCSPPHLLRLRTTPFVDSSKSTPLPGLIAPPADEGESWQMLRSAAGVLLLQLPEENNKYEERAQSCDCSFCPVVVTKESGLCV